MIFVLFLYTVRVCKGTVMVLNSDFKQERRYGRSRFCRRGLPPDRILGCNEVSRIAFVGAVGSERSDTPTVAAIVT